MTNSPLFSFVHKLQGDLPYGRLLDAGAGPRSLGWLRTLDTDSCTAVTAAPAMARQVQSRLGEWRRRQDRMIIGNWTDPNLLAGEQFDTVLADNLLSAAEAYAPYFETELFERLRQLTVKRLYVIGMEPYVVERPSVEAGTLVWEVGRYRDACQILTGQRPYREYPLEWISAKLRRSGFKPLAVGKFPVGYEAKFVNNQIGLCRPLLERMADQTLRRALIAHGEDIKSRALTYIERNGSLGPSLHYVVAAEPV